MPYRIDPTTGNKTYLSPTGAVSGGVPSEQPAGMTTKTTQPTQGGGLLGGGTDWLQQLLGLGAVSKGQYGTAWSILQPPTEETAGTAAEKARTRTGISVVGEIQKTPEDILKRTGTLESMVTSFKLTFPGGLARPFISKKENELADLESNYFILVQSVMTAIQGSRPSDYDVKSYQDKAGPSIKFPYYVNQERIENLTNLLNAKLGLPATPSRPSLSSFER